MDLTQSTDYLKFEENILATPYVNNDIVLFSNEIYKINRYWTQQKIEYFESLQSMSSA